MRILPANLRPARLSDGEIQLLPEAHLLRMEMEHLRIKYGSNKNNMVKSMVKYQPSGKIYGKIYGKSLLIHRENMDQIW